MIPPELKKNKKKNVPMVEMITMERVQAYIARGAPVSLLCQSKNSEVLNTFHPDGGGGAGSTIRKRVEKPLACQFLGLVMPRVCVCSVLLLSCQEDTKEL